MKFIISVPNNLMDAMEARFREPGCPYSEREECLIGLLKEWVSNAVAVPVSPPKAAPVNILTSGISQSLVESVRVAAEQCAAETGECSVSGIVKLLHAGKASTVESHIGRILNTIAISFDGNQLIAESFGEPAYQIGGSFDSPYDAANYIHDSYSRGWNLTWTKDAE